MNEIVKCPFCGKTFKKKVKNQKYCSESCSNRVHKPLRPRINKTCPECNKEFEGTKKDKYCTKECKRIVKNKKNKKYNERVPIKMTCVVCGRKFRGRMFSPLCSIKCRKIFDKENNNG